MKYAYIRSIAHYIPEGRITNEQVLERLKAANKDGFNQEELEYLIYGCQRKLEFLGIHTRSCSTEGKDDSIIGMGVKVAREAMEKAQLSPETVDCVLFTGITNPYREPAGACIVANAVGIERGDFYDINDTCNGFMKCIEIAGMYINHHGYRNVMIVTSENPVEVEKGLGVNIRLKELDESDNRLSNLIVGAGAGAMILSSEGERRRVLKYANRRETINWDASLLRIPQTKMPETRYGGEIEGFWSDGRLISRETIKQIPIVVKECLKEWGVALESIDRFILHQLGNNVTYAILDALEVDHTKAPVNTFRECGNMGTANIPVNIGVADEEGAIREGESLLLLSSSCGLTYSVAYIHW